VVGGGCKEFRWSVRRLRGGVLEEREFVGKDIFGTIDDCGARKLWTRHSGETAKGIGPVKELQRGEEETRRMGGAWCVNGGLVGQVGRGVSAKKRKKKHDLINNRLIQRT